MNDIKVKYKKTINKTGVTLLAFTVFIEVFMTVYAFVDILINESIGGKIAVVASSVLYDVAYLASFMLPAVVMTLSCGRRVQPFRFEPKLSVSNFALIATGVACVFAFSFINSIAVDIFPLQESEGIFNISYDSDYSLVLQFITIALVPGFCEEFLFRGVILSNLMPYGKSTAIVISALCFGLMHSNFVQFLYATVAGIILGTVYVMTDSIWPSTFIHIINNALSILQIAMFEKMNEDIANTMWLFIECFVFALGVLGAVVVVKKYKTADKRYQPVFGRRIDNCYEGSEAALGGHIKIDQKDALKLFFAPAMVAFIVICIGKAFLVLLV